ncbi:MAG TPA: hypothetical protein VK169_09100 [Saprospiraceae bacterium]|nr:hypothetical protein [Saprospiraceae bacterium]
MRTKANIINVLISSPDDCKLERKIVEQTIFDFNARFSDFNDIYFLNPITYEKYYLASAKGETQSGINEQVVSKCDIGIAIFKEKIGGDENRESGTQQEIKFLLDNDKEVKIHLSKIPSERYIYKDLEDINRKGSELIRLYDYFSQLKRINTFYAEIIDEIQLKESVEKFLNQCLINIRTTDRIREIEEYKENIQKDIIKPNRLILSKDKNTLKYEKYNSSREMIINNLSANKLKTKGRYDVEDIKNYVIDIIEKIENIKNKEFDTNRGIPFDAFTQIVKSIYPFIENSEFGFALSWKFFAALLKDTNYGLYLDDSKINKDGNKDLYVFKVNALKSKDLKMINNIEFPIKNSLQYYKNFLETKSFAEITLPNDFSIIQNIFMFIESLSMQKIEKQVLIDTLKEYDKNYRSILTFLIKSNKIEQFDINNNLYLDVKQIDGKKELHDFYEYVLNVLKLKLKDQEIDESEFKKLFFND